MFRIQALAGRYCLYLYDLPCSKSSCVDQAMFVLLVSRSGCRKLLNVSIVETPVK